MLPVAETRWKIAPRNAGAIRKVDGVDKQPIVDGRPTDMLMTTKQPPFNVVALNGAYAVPAHQSVRLWPTAFEHPKIDLEIACLTTRGAKTDQLH